MSQIIKLGTRGSKLALWQANKVAQTLKKNGVECEIIIIDTKGDQILDRSLSKIGSKGLFTAELEQGLFDGTLDIAVHSAKDLPSALPVGLQILAFMKRENPADVLVSLDHTLRLSSEASFSVGTSSTRRRAVLQAYYPHIKLAEMRGNLQTRMAKLADGHCQAMLLAYAGVKRMRMHEHIVQTLDIEQFVPSVGQGSVAIEIALTMHADLQAQLKKALNDAKAERAILAERAFLKIMEGGCSVPVFAHAQIKKGHIFIKGGVISLDGQQMCIHTARGIEPIELGETLAQAVLVSGGSEILKDIKIQLNG
jgi:hydroxymethylbilane synthase